MLLKTAAAIVLLIASARAIDVPDLPPCATSCVENAISDQTTCSPTDASCLCADKELGDVIGDCLGLTCDVVDVETSVQMIENFCQSVSSGTAAKTTAALYSAITADSTATATSIAGSDSSSGNNSKQKSSGGLSTAAKVGIGVGVPLGVLLVAGGIILAYVLGTRKRNTPTAQASSAEKPSTAQPSPQSPVAHTSVPVDAKFAPSPAVTEVYSPPPMIQHPNIDQIPGSISSSESTIVQPQYESQASGATSVTRQYDLSGIEPQA